MLNQMQARQGCLSAFIIGLLAAGIVFLAWHNWIIALIVFVVFFIAWLFD
jgi:hypothetical protein